MEDTNQQSIDPFTSVSSSGERVEEPHNVAEQPISPKDERIGSANASPDGAIPGASRNVQDHPVTSEAGAIPTFYPLNSYSPQDPGLYYGGYDNGTGSWVEQSNDGNVNNLHVAPPGMFNENPLFFPPGYGFDPQMAFGQFSPIASPLSPFMIDGQLYSHQIPVSPPYYAPPVSPGLPHVTSALPASQPDLVAPGSTGHEIDGTHFGPGSGYYIPVGPFGGGELSGSSNMGFYNYQGEVGSGQSLPNLANPVDSGRYISQMTSARLYPPPVGILGSYEQNAMQASHQGLGFTPGSLSRNFLITEEDPATGIQVDAVLVVGDSIEVTLILNPPPDIPVRLDIVSTTPSIVFPSHDTITFNRGVNRGTITLESPEDGKIGIATILVVPEKLGFYRPTSLSVLVQGIATLEQVDDCVAASLPAKFQIKLWPPSPDNDVFTIHSSNGIVSNNTFEFITGDITGEFTFTGSKIGNSSITIESDFYVSTTLHFQTYGRIITETDLRAVEGAPSPVSVSIFPTEPIVPVTILATNAEIHPFGPEIYVGGEEPTEIEVVPIYFGFSNVTYTAPDHCPHIDYYSVANAPACNVISEENIEGTECYECPGSELYFDSSYVCSGNGECTYTHCFTDRVRCSCALGYVGYACQWNEFDDFFQFTYADLNDEPIELYLEYGGNLLVEEISLSAPGDLIDPELQVGTAIAAPFPFFGAIFPEEVPPMGAEYTGVTFYWENTCFDNALITEDFNEPAVAKFPLSADAFSHRNLLEMQLCLWNATSEGWIDSIDACGKAGFEVERSVDLFSYTFTTYFCQPGQYALFLIPISSPVPNTGNTNNPHPDAEDVSDTFFLISTGWQPAPPLPLPDVALNFDPSPLLKNQPFGSQSSASTLLLSLSVILLAFILHL